MNRFELALNCESTQKEFAEFIGVSEARVSQMKSEGLIKAGDTILSWVRADRAQLREQAAGRMGEESGGLDLVQERAALAREQRISQALKNDIARGEYAPIGLLTDVLATGSSAIVDELDQLDGALKKACPNLPNEALAVIATVLASARNKWIRSTAQLIDRSLDELLADQSDEDPADTFAMDDQD